MILITLQTPAEAKLIRQRLIQEGLWVRLLQGERQTFFWVDPSSAKVDLDYLRSLPGVAEVIETPSPHPLIDKQPSQLDVEGIPVGFGAPPCFIAGPCSIESESQVQFLAEKVAKAGAAFLRGGAFKPRTSPYAFQGHGAKALKWLRDAADQYHLKVVTEVLDTIDVPQVAETADLIQIGARNMYNYALLKSAGRAEKAVLLKRGFSATIEEWLSAGEYCLMHGAKAVIFCERGIRGFDSNTRNLIDIGAVALLSHVKKLPVVVDPSHAVGRRDLIPALSRAALAAGAAGVMIETHQSPGEALSDGSQALPLNEVGPLFAELRHMGRGF